MIKFKPLIILILLVGLPFSIAISAHGQLQGRQTTDITGVVQDPNGAVVPKARITVTNKNTGQVSSATTDSSGRFTVRNVEAGIYDVQAEGSGFKTKRLSNVSVQLSQSTSLNIVFDDTQPIVIVTKVVFIKGSVRSDRTNRPIKSATVTIKEVDGEGSWTPTIGKDGKYKQELPPGKYKVSAKADGFVDSAEEEQEVRKGTKTQDFRLVPK